MKMQWMTNLVFLLTFFFCRGLAESVKGCGRTKSQTNYDYVPGFKNAAPGQIPWQARLFNTYKFNGGTDLYFCGGALIHEEWVLTAAHCFFFDDVVRKPKLDSLRVRVGDPWTEDVVTSEIKDVIIYPGFESGGKTFKGDVALVRLKTPIHQKNLSPVSLPEMDTNFRGDADCFASGWRDIYSNIQIATGQIIQQKDLNDAWDGYISKRIAETNIGFQIAGSIDGHFSKNLDGGSPIVCKKPGTIGWELVGVIAAGNLEESKPLVLAEVGKFIDWIHHAMKSETMQACGVRSSKRGWIVGGDDTFPGEIPWQMAIIHEYAHIKSHGKEPKTRTCGAVLIRKDWVLTAARCFDLGGGKLISNTTYWQVRGGDWRRDVIDKTEVDINVKKIFGHPNYEVSRFGVKNDIALLKLKRPFDIEDTYESVEKTSIGLACLPLPNANYRMRWHCTLSGFGHLGFEKPKYLKTGENNDNIVKSYKEELVPIYADIMQQVSGQVWRQEVLTKAWNPLHGLIRLVNADMIGFGGDTTKSHPTGDPWGACSGDSGGPLVCPFHAIRPLGRPYDAPPMTVVGVVSFGAPKCDEKPTILTEVSKYRQWIETTILEEDFKAVKMPDYDWKNKE